MKEHQRLEMAPPACSEAVKREQSEKKMSIFSEESYLSPTQVMADFLVVRILVRERERKKMFL